jgi:hypothetical protein
MIRAKLLPLTTLVLLVSVPLAWLACGGGSKPAESPASDTASTGSSTEPAASDSAASAASASASSAADTPAPASTPEPAASSPPPTPSFDKTDCGKCVDKSCAKQAAACGKDNDCQVMLDSVHACTSGGAGCVDSASAPTAAKPKKLATAFETCGKKAVGKGGACAKQCK